MPWRLVSPLSRRGACLHVAVACSLIALVWYLARAPNSGHRPSDRTSLAKPHDLLAARRLCQSLPGANETAVVIKTSAAELEDRLPVHFETTLLCSHNYIIFSDWDETFKNHSIRDALSSVSPKTSSSHPDFELWRRLQNGGSDVLEDEEIWQSARTTKDLDKWKILPMLSQTFAEFPDLRWYVFMPTNTFVFWSNLLAWLRELNSHDPHYIISSQSHSGIADTGPGFILSQNSMKLLTQQLDGHPSDWETLTETLPSADAVLGNALGSVGVTPSFASPMMYTGSPGSLDHDKGNPGNRRWCHPAVSYHGVSPGDIAALWKFEQERLHDKPGELIRGSDVFQQFIKPRLVIRSGRVDDWDNYSSANSIWSLPAASVAKCLQLCMGDDACVQFSFVDDTCHLSAVPQLGDFALGVRSRWILPRLERWAAQVKACAHEECTFL